MLKNLTRWNIFIFCMVCLTVLCTACHPVVSSESQDQMLAEVNDWVLQESEIQQQLDDSAQRFETLEKELYSSSEGGPLTLVQMDSASQANRQQISLQVQQDLHAAWKATFSLHQILTDSRAMIEGFAFRRVTQSQSTQVWKRQQKKITNSFVQLEFRAEDLNGTVWLWEQFVNRVVPNNLEGQNPVP